jgi:hypothetical protein
MYLNLNLCLQLVFLFILGALFLCDKLAISPDISLEMQN